MNLILDLPPELASQLTAEAAHAGLPLDRYALLVLAGNQVANATPKTGAELVAYWRNEGVIGMRDDIEDPAEHSRALRNRAQLRERE